MTSRTNWPVWESAFQPTLAQQWPILTCLVQPAQRPLRALFRDREILSFVLGDGRDEVRALVQVARDARAGYECFVESGTIALHTHTAPTQNDHAPLLYSTRKIYSTCRNSRRETTSEGKMQQRAQDRSRMLPEKTLSANDFVVR